MDEFKHKDELNVMSKGKQVLDIYHRAIGKNTIPNELYPKHDVKKGLRNEDGTGVVVGLTRICDVMGYKVENGRKVDVPGELFYRDFTLDDLYNKVAASDETGYEDTCFLLLYGYLPDAGELLIFKSFLQSEYSLPEGFISRNILRSPTINIMNKIQRAILLLYGEDENPDDPGIDNTLRQGLSVIAKLPAICVYCYQAKVHLLENRSLVIHPVKNNLSMAESFLYLLKGEGNYTHEEVMILDLMMILHADHGIGNNSTFASLVVSSTQTDLYSCFAAAVGSLKGPRHGGANITCRQMMKAVIDDIGTDASDDEIQDVVRKMLRKEYFDRSGLIYGMGHAVYTISDPRSELLREHATTVAKQKGRVAELEFFKRFADIACAVIYEVKGKNVCANVDFYSGFIYDMLGVPEDLYTPLFVISRAIGWLAHNLEDKININKIIRPAGKFVGNNFD
jgi:citrate synthase